MARSRSRPALTPGIQKDAGVPAQDDEDGTITVLGQVDFDRMKVLEAQALAALDILEAGEQGAPSAAGS